MQNNVLMSCEQIASKILHHFGKDVYFTDLSTVTYRTVREKTSMLTNILIVNVPGGCRTAPECIDKRWALLYAAGYSEKNGKYRLFCGSRWNEKMHWQYSDKSETTRSLKRGRYHFLIYVQVDGSQNLNSSKFINMSGGQSKLRCGDHSDYYLMRENSKETTLKCAILRCRNKLSWKCSFGFAGSMHMMPCTVGVCAKHGKEMLLSDEVTFVKRNCENDNFKIEEESGNETSSDGSDSEFESERNLREDVEPDVQEPCVVFTDVFHEEDVASTNLTNASYVDNGIGGHFLIKSLISMSNKSVFDNNVSLKWNNFLTYVHSIVSEKLLPLLYVEALLFPKIFWALDNGAPVGALPSVFYTEYGKMAVPMGFASWEDHMTVRLSDQTLLTSRDHNYLAFMFDCHINMLLNRSTSSIAMKKGFEHITSAAIVVDDSEYRVAFDEMDSRRTVSRLSSMMRDFPWSMFVTITCNLSSTMGMRLIRKALEEKYGKNTPQLHIALQNYTGIFCKAWVKVVKMFFNYIVASKEDVLGDVVTFWLRFEFQSAGAPGNLPHVHAGLSLRSDSRYTREELCRKVHNKITQIFSSSNETDYKSLLRKGVVKDLDEFVSMYELAEKLFVHSCSKARFSCSKQLANGSKYCRVPVYQPGYEPTEKVWDSVFDIEFLNLLSEINLAKKSNLNGEVSFEVDEVLRCSTWNYPKEPGIRSVPTNGILFSIFRSMVNVQVCSRKFMSSYLAKYVAKVNEMKEVYLGRQSDTLDISVERADESNNLGTGQSSNSKKCNSDKQKKGDAKDSKRTTYREVGLAEMLWKLHKLPYILTNVEFVHYSTHAPEQRYYVKKHFMNMKPKTNDILNLEVVAHRRNLPSWRQFSHNQLLMIQQLESSNFYVDKTTSFSIRPPELLFINRVELYVKYFTLESGKFNLQEDFSNSPFIDGMKRRVRVRIVYLFSVRDMLRVADNQQNESISMLLPLLNSLCEQVNRGEISQSFHIFVDSSAINEVVPVMSNIDVNVPGKFLIHLLISMGRFETEHELYTETSLYDSFVKAGLVDKSISAYDNWRRLCEAYAREQLLYFPLTTKSFAQKLSLGASILKTFLMRGIIDYAMPICTERLMKEAALDSVKQMVAEKRRYILSAIVQQGFPGCPSLELMESNKNFLYVPQLSKLHSQSNQSFGEQVLAKERLILTIDEYCSSGCTAVRFPLLMGPPGAGKTYLLLMACLYAISKGLVCAISAITGERARMLGGVHLHSMFGFRNQSGSFGIPNILAANCLASLARNPLQVTYLKTLDVLFIEEIGLVPGHLLHVIDYVLRTIRDSSKPYGGILIISSGDHKQLAPVEGQSVWVSVERLIQFQILLLKHYVRCRSDSELEKVLSVMRLSTPSSEDIKYACDRLLKRCSSNVVQTWDHVPEKYFRIVSKVDATLSIINRYIQSKMEKEEYFVSIASDEMKDTANVWMSANSSTSKRMNKIFKEPYKLVFFARSVMCLTYNGRKFDKNGTSFSQGQLVVILEIPNENHDVTSRYVKVKLVPPGERSVDVNKLPNEWPELKLKRRKTATHQLKFSHCYVRRDQWPLKPYVCSTIHKSIGETIPFVATQISCDGPYKVWDRNQVLVLLSRVPSLSNLMFVGQLDENLAAVKEVLLKVDSLEQNIDYIVEKCNVLLEGDRFIAPSHCIPNLTIEIPSVPCGYVYMIFSQKFGEFRINECEDLRKELKEVNNVLRHDNDKHLQPWVLICFVFGFRNDVKHVDNIKGRIKIRDSWVEHVLQNNISKFEQAVACLVPLYETWVRDEILSDIIIRQVVTLKEPVQPDFLPLALTDTNGRIENSIDISSSSILEKLPSTATLNVFNKNIEVVNEPLPEFVEGRVNEIGHNNVDYVGSDICGLTKADDQYECSEIISEDSAQLNKKRKRGSQKVSRITSSVEVESNLVDAQRSVGDACDVIELQILDSEDESGERVLDFSLCKRTKCVSKKFKRMWRWSSVDAWSNGYVLSHMLSSRLLGLVTGVEMDGHCLFQSIAESMHAQFSYDLEVSRLVKLCRQEFSENRSEYVFSCDVRDSEQLADEYLDLRKYDNEFADMAPVMLANVLQIKITILEKLINNSLRVTCVEARNQIESTDTIYVLKEGMHYNAFNKFAMNPLPNGALLDEQCSKRILELVIPVQGDGHCLFRSIAHSMQAQYERCIEVSRLVRVCRREFNHNKSYYAVEQSIAELEISADHYLVSKLIRNDFANLAPWIIAGGLQVEIVVLDKQSNGSLKVSNREPRVAHQSRRKVFILKENLNYYGLKNET